MKDKVSQVCDYILDRLESGEYKAGELIPSARKIEKEVDASFAMVQHAVNALAQAGILRSINRQGSVVRENWRNGLLPNHFVIWEPERLWVPGFRRLFEERLPDFRLCSVFKRGMFELRTTLYVQQHKDEYLDLAPLFRKLYGDGAEFFEFPFRGFIDSNGALAGVPFIFSPRVIFYRPDVLKKFGCAEPHSEWTWSEFLETVRKLREHLSADRVLNFHSAPFFWINFVFNCGGSILDPGAEDPVRIDSPETCAGIGAVRELYRILGPQEPDRDFSGMFMRGESAMMLSEREQLCVFKHRRFDAWQTAPLPKMPGGTPKMAQATDLICVRRECVDPEMAETFLSFMLSGEVQNYIAEEKYGIPIRKSAARRTIDRSDKRDLLFLKEMENMSAEYNMDSPELMGLVQRGISQIIEDSAKPLEESLRKLADAVRLFLEIKSARNGRSGR